MMRAMKWAGLCLMSVLSLPVAAQPASLTPMALGQKEPPAEAVREDGSVDHITWGNALLSEGIEPDQNAAVAVAQIMPEDRWPDEWWRDELFERLGVDVPGDEVPRFQPFDRYIEEHVPEAEFGASEALDAALAERWGEGDFALVSDWLAEQEVVFAWVAEGVQRERFWMPWIRDEPSIPLEWILLPSLRVEHDLARGLGARVQQRLAAGDVDGALDDLLTIKRLGDHRKEAGMGIEQLVGVSIVALGRNLVPFIVSDEHFAPAHGRRMLDELPPIGGRFPIERAIDIGERLILLESLVRMPDDWGQVRRVISVHGVNVRPWFMEDAIVERYLDQDLARDKTHELHNRLVEALSHRGYPERMAGLQDFAEDMDRKFLDSAVTMTTPAGMMALYDPGLSEAERRQKYTDDLFGLSASVYSAGHVAAGTVGTQEAMASELELVAAALGGYRTEQGAYPESLDALTPRWLETIPEDRFSPGDRVRYRLEMERVVIYSVGRNGRDNGGVISTQPQEGDLVLAWQRTARKDERE